MLGFRIRSSEVITPFMLYSFMILDFDTIVGTMERLVVSDVRRSRSKSSKLKNSS